MPLDCSREPIVNAIDASVLGWLATVDLDGQPSVSPKEIFCASADGLLLIANIASPNSARNIAGNPKVCFSMVDIFEQTGLKLIGEAATHFPQDPNYPDLEAPLRKIAPLVFPFRSIFALRIYRTEPIIAPSYYIRPDLTPEDRRNAAYKTYGVAPAIAFPSSAKREIDDAQKD